MDEIKDTIGVSCLNGNNIQFLKDKLSSDYNNNIENDLNSNILDLSQILLEDENRYELIDRDIYEDQPVVTRDNIEEKIHSDDLE